MLHIIIMFQFLSRPPKQQANYISAYLALGPIIRDL